MATTIKDVRVVDGLQTITAIVNNTNPKLFGQYASLKRLPSLPKKEGY